LENLQKWFVSSAELRTTAIDCIVKKKKIEKPAKMFSDVKRFHSYYIIPSVYVVFTCV